MINLSLSASAHVSSPSFPSLNDNSNVSLAATRDESSTVNILGGTLNAGGSVVVAADDDINISGMTYEELDFHRSKKSGVGGLSKKDKGAVEADNCTAVVIG